MSIKMTKRDFLEMFLGVLFSVIISLLAVIIFAVIVKYANLSTKVVGIVNIFLKIFSIFFGSLIALKSGRKGLFKGCIIGLFFSLVSYLIFSLINGSFAINPLTAFDILSCLVAGLLSGVFAVNVRREK